MKRCVLSSFLFLACLANCRPSDGCEPASTRCHGNIAEICDADGSYYELADCDVVSERSGAPFVCAFVDEETEEGRTTGHTCVPASEASGAAGGAR